MAGTNSAGNRHKSIAQHKLDGTYRKDRHGDVKTPEPSAGRPDAPAELDSLEHGEWESLWADLEDMGMQFRVDAKAAYQYVKLFAETERIGEKQAEARAGLRILEENLGDMQAEDKVQLFSQIVALHKEVSKATDQLRQGRMAIRPYLVEFGLTPASRGRIKLPTKKDEQDAFAKHQLQRVK